MSHLARMRVAQAMTTLIYCWPVAEITNYESEVHGFLGRRFIARPGTVVLKRSSYKEGDRSYSGRDEMEIADVLSRVQKLRVLNRSSTCGGDFQASHMVPQATLPLWRKSIRVPKTDRPNRRASIRVCPREGPPLGPTTAGFIGRGHVEKLLSGVCSAAEKVVACLGRRTDT